MDRQTFQTIIFDLDGTLVNSAQGIFNSILYALKEMGIENVKRESLYPFIGPPMKDSFMEFFHFPQEKALQAVELYRAHYQKKGLYEIELYDGMEETLRALKNAGKTILMGTSKRELFAKKIAEYLNINDCFDLIAGSNFEGTRDKKREVLEYALHQLGIEDFSKVLMVGDRKFDVLGAGELGIDTLGVLYGFGSRNELETAGAKWIVETPKDIAKLILEK